MSTRGMFGRVGVALIGFAGIVTLAAFRGPPGHMGGGPGPEGFFGARIEHLLDDVDATPQQRDQIRVIAGRLRDKGKAMREGHQQERAQLISSFEAGKLDRNQVVAQVDRHAEQMKAFGHDVADAMVEVQKILTPEQRAKVAEHMRRQPGRMQRGPGAPPAPPPPSAAPPAAPTPPSAK